jgi:hypothetical protein
VLKFSLTVLLDGLVIVVGSISKGIKVWDRVKRTRKAESVKGGCGKNKKSLRKD